MEPHLSPESFDAFLMGTCAEEQASRVEAHIDSCAECRILLSSLVRSRREAQCHTTDVFSAPGCPALNEVVGGKYRVERVLGTGGMGTVVAAWHQQLNQRVALKFIRPELVADPQAVGRFHREGRAAARLKTRHVGRVLDLDTLPTGTPFLVMEYLEGETAEQRLAKDKCIALPVAAEWMRQVFEALAEAHGLGIVHRDLKPANLFLCREPDGRELVKVLDFGIAKSVHPDIEQGLGSTSARVMVGSPPYMAPEQLNPDAVVDARADVWALGVVLFQLLSGKLPFEAPNLVELMFAIQTRPPRPLAELVPKLPSAVVAVIERCLAKDPGQRFPDVAALSSGLEGALAPSAAVPAVAAKQRPKRAVLFAAGLVTVLSAVAALVGLGKREPAPVQVERAAEPKPAPAPTPTEVSARAAAPLPEPELVPLPVMIPKAKAAPSISPPRAAKKKAAAQSDDDVFGDRR